MIRREIAAGILSLNIACAARDEKNNPLERRLPLICELLKKHKTEDISIVVIQEIRATGSLSVQQVINKLSAALGDWRYTEMSPNQSSGGLVRAVFYDETKLNISDVAVGHIQNTTEPQFPRLIRTVFFNKRDGGDNKSLFGVGDLHAPMKDVERFEYWQNIKWRISGSRCPVICIGDLNKFESDLGKFFDIFPLAGDITDDIHQSQTTFVSFKDDLDKNGNKWRCCLDGLIYDHSVFECNRLDIISTEAEKEEDRPTDHFLISCRMIWK